MPQGLKPGDQLPPDHPYHGLDFEDADFREVADVDFEKFFRQGTYARVKPSRFDSRSEEIVCLILNRILRDYDLERKMQLRLTPQQALDNYVDVKDDDFAKYYRNKYKWMKFDFIFEEVYEHRDRMHYVPVAVVEFDGPHHDTEEQRKRDYYKNGIVSNIGAAMVRIRYDSLSSLDEAELRDEYEDEILQAIIKGYFTRSVNRRREDSLINGSNRRKFDLVAGRYEKGMRDDREHAAYYGNMLRLLHASRELAFVSGN